MPIAPGLSRTRLKLPLLLACAAALAEAPAQSWAPPGPGSVLFHDKLSSTAGGFAGPLADEGLFGVAIAALGDLDGDGLLDLAVGAYTDNDGGPFRGSLWILFLAADGSVKASQKISTTQGGLVGPLHDGDLFGWSLAALGDLDGDGAPELAVGSWLDDDGGLPNLDFGAVWILSLNPDGTVKHERKLSPTQGGFTGALASGDRFGTSLAALGDLDGDGVDDLAAGAIYDDDGGINAGAVWILFLHADGSVKTQRKLSPLEGGAGGGGLLGPIPENSRMGYSSALLGDLTGDGRPELAVGALLDPDGGAQRGAVWIYSLDPDGSVAEERKISSTSGQFVGPLQDYDTFGRSVAALGDLDADGVVDLAVGAGNDSEGGLGQGAIWILRLNADGTVKAQQKLSSLHGSFDGVLDEFDDFGQAAAALGDLDGDGVADLAVGAMLDDDGGPERGAVWLLHLSDGTWGNLLHGTPGALGTPRLRGAGSLQPGTPFTLLLDRVPPLAPVLLLFGAQALGLPTHGGVLVPDPSPPGGSVLLAMPPSGVLSLGAIWPAAVPAGLVLHLQAWAVDAAGPAGLSASNGLTAVPP